MGDLTSVKIYISLTRAYPGLTPVVGMLRVMIEGYLSSWKFGDKIEILTCEERISIEGASESWPIFRIYITGIIIKHVIFQLISLASVGGYSNTPPPPIFPVYLAGGGT